MLKQKKIFTFQLVIEVLIMLVFPIPFYDKWVVLVVVDPNDHEIEPITYYMSDILMAFMFLRLWFVFRTIMSRSKYLDAYSKNLCKMYGFSTNTRFALKCYFKNHPERTFACIFVLSIFLLSYLIRIFELPFFRETETDFGGRLDLFNSVWLISITVTSVGYGDVVPHTNPGKMIAIIAAFWGAFLISLLVVAATHLFDLNRNQNRA